MLVNWGHTAGVALEQIAMGIPLAMGAGGSCDWLQRDWLGRSTGKWPCSHYPTDRLQIKTRLVLF